MRRQVQWVWVGLGVLLGLGTEFAGGRPAAAQVGVPDEIVGRATGFGQLLLAPGQYASFSFRLNTRDVGVRQPGQLRFVDPGTGAVIVSQTITTVLVGPDLALIEGIATINGVPGTFQMEAFDAGRPGETDALFICYQTLFDESCVGGLVRGGNLFIRLERAR